MLKGRESSRTEQREKLGCDALSRKASADSIRSLLGFFVLFEEIRVLLGHPGWRTVVQSWLTAA